MFTSPRFSSFRCTVFQDRLGGFTEADFKANDAFVRNIEQHHLPALGEPGEYSIGQ
ncbi:hypothetical protein D3C75_977520 [compost metagenome]